ncbi:DUF2860 domain-containing protein [Vibrio mytili]|uniref:DUF2860 domain-containing protein n=1 Tax=Vibrio mytili TaxID=50718 RepID=UPI002F423F84
MRLKLALLPLALVVSTSQAQLADNQGFSGEISVIAGYASTESNLNTDNSKTINSLNQKGESESSAVIAPLGNVAYTFGSALNHQVYMGTSRSDVAIGTLAFQLGYQYQLDSGTVLDFSYLPTLVDGETWSNPYQTGSARSTTDESGNAFRFQAKGLIDKNFNLELGYAERDVENDDVIGFDDSLARDADVYYFKGSYRISMTPTSILQPAFTYIMQDAEGDAESFDSYGADLSWFKFINQHRLALTAGYTLKDFQSASQTFGKKRSDDTLSLFAAYEYENVFDWQDWSFVSFAGYSQTDSNLTFFDEKEYLLSLGLNYKF